MLTTLAALALSIPSSFIPVQSGPCNALQKFPTTQAVTLEVKPVKYIRNIVVSDLHDQMSKKLYEWQKEKGQNPFYDQGVDVIHNWTVSGSSNATIHTDIDVEFISVPYNVVGKEYCSFFKDVKITLTYQTETRIAKELPPDSCRYQVINEHEKLHDEANIKVAQSVAEMLEADLPRILMAVQGDPSHIKFIDERLASMKQGLQNAVRIYEDDLFKLVDDYNEIIDTPEEFRRIANSCGWEAPED